MNKRGLKGVLVGISRVTGVTALSRTLTRGGFNIIGFHGVSLLDEHRRFPTLFISEESFERRLRFLASRYRIISLQDALEQHRKGRIAPRQVVLTFDDGFYNFLGRAVPLLKKYNAPATVYIVTSGVESGEPMFNLLLKDVMLSTRHRTATGLPHAPGDTVDLSTSERRNAAIASIVQEMYRHPTIDARLRFCRDLARALGVDIEPTLRARVWDRLTPGEIRQVVNDGFDVQLHTHSHRNVVEHRAGVRDEVRTNREALERLAGKPAVHFCYPLGLWDKAIWPDLVAEGVQSAVTTKNGPNFPKTPALSLRRYLTGEAMTQREFEFELSGVRWLAGTVRRHQNRFAPSEKRVRYSEQPDLY
jgi:peptidoglycan/xylan/chitin deacetylase (PgdA/CDA1 family)